MRSYPPITAAYFASRAAFRAHLLVWVSARNRTSGLTESIGFWTGADHAEFVLEGETRTYYGAGAMLTADPIRSQTGLKVRTWRIVFNQVAPEAQQLIRGYDARHAPVEVHRALFDPEGEQLIDTPHLVRRGFIDKAPITTPPKGETGGQIAIEISTQSRALTRPVSRYRSDASLRGRAPADAFRKYASIADSVDTKWGTS